MRYGALSLVAVLSGLAISSSVEAQSCFGNDNSTHGCVGGRTQGIPPYPVTRIPRPHPYTYQYREPARPYVVYGSVADYIYQRGGRVVAPSPIYYEDRDEYLPEREYVFPANQKWFIWMKDGSRVEVDMPPPVGTKPHRGARWACRLAAQWHCLWSNPASKSPSVQFRFYPDQYYGYY